MIIEFLKNLSGFELIYDGGMLIWAVWIFIMLLAISAKFNAIVEDTKKAYSSTKSETKIDTSGNAVEDISRRFNREKHEPIRAKYTELAVSYIKWTSFISTLPIAGLLGTVIGLIPGLIAVRTSDFDALYSALSTALSSTAIGLFASLILKIYVSAGPDAKLNEIEILFDQIDRRYDIAIGAGNVTR